jgi:DNA mismatch endonuclease (patch repair protein)
MTDVVDTATRSRMMSGIRAKDTTPEMFLRRALHAEGFRYRLGGAKLPGRPDLVFPGRKTVVFVHGCFWHQHSCKYFKWPKTNADFWRTKLEGNTARDARVVKQLEAMGWRVLTAWECELRETGYQLPNKAVSAIAEALNGSVDHQSSR